MQERRFPQPGGRVAGAYRRSCPVCLGWMVGARRWFRSAGFGSPARHVGGGELGPGLGRLHSWPGPAAGGQCRPSQAVGL
eukprot:7708537-Alexandrium_andersonii.AAC.1